jgi:hypothetical protein
MSSEFEGREAANYYDKLGEYAAVREREIYGMMEPYVALTDRYGRLIARLTSVLGQLKPKDTQDIVIRDLMADVFDFLYEARTLILAGKCSVAYPLARRAYESLSLLHLCTLDPAWAKKWHNGQRISNAQVRRALGSDPMGESEQNTKVLYKFFCTATHPNRELIPQRLLGDGNEFVLGAIAMPNLVLIADYCIKLLEMWFWLAATVSHFYRSHLEQHDRSYFETYMAAAADAQEMKRWLIDNYNRVLEEVTSEGEG